MLARLYVVPFKGTLILAKDAHDATSVHKELVQYVRDVKDKSEVYWTHNGLKLRTSYLGRNDVMPTAAVKEELKCSC